MKAKKVSQGIRIRNNCGRSTEDSSGRYAAGAREDLWKRAMEEGSGRTLQEDLQKRTIQGLQKRVIEDKQKIAITDLQMKAMEEVKEEHHRKISGRQPWKKAIKNTTG